LFFFASTFRNERQHRKQKQTDFFYLKNIPRSTVVHKRDFPQSSRMPKRSPFVGNFFARNDVPKRHRKLLKDNIYGISESIASTPTPSLHSVKRLINGFLIAKPAIRFGTPMAT
jgi:hypothetical protein